MKLQKNQQALAVWAREFKNNDLDAVFVFTHAPGSSAYNPVERRIAPLSNDAAGIILAFGTFGNHLDASIRLVLISIAFHFKKKMLKVNESLNAVLAKFANYIIRR